MRRLVILFFSLALLMVLGLSLLSPGSSLNHPAQIVALLLLALIIADRLLGLFSPRRRSKTPPSQIAEMERLYFRSIREMLNDSPNLVQVINDLQRILATSNYKNARHYLKRALLLQAQSADAGGQNGYAPPSRTEFLRLQEQLIDPDPNLRKSVVMALLQYGDLAVDPLIALLMDEDSDVRIHAATALGWIGGSDAVQPLAVALKDTNPYVRRYAARALCWVVNESAVDDLLDALHDEDNYVRQYAARALGWSQNARAIAPLLGLLNDPTADVRESAAIALDDLGEIRPEQRAALSEQV
jgi:HEAT repeat protein